MMLASHPQTPDEQARLLAALQWAHVREGGAGSPCFCPRCGVDLGGNPQVWLSLAARGVRLTCDCGAETRLTQADVRLLTHGPQTR